MNSKGIFEFYSGHCLLEEIQEHRERLKELSELNEEDFETAKSFIFSKITFLSENLIPFEYWQKAAELVRDVDMDDISFVSLNNYLGAKLWTGDKTLLKHLRHRMGYELCVSTAELLAIREDIRKK
jgi:predicted nucleic acid-binding protein